MNAQEFAYNQLLNLKASDPETFGQMDEHSVRKVCYELAKPQYRISKEAGKLTYTAALKGLGMDRKPKESKKSVGAVTTSDDLTSEIRAIIPQTVVAQSWSRQHGIDPQHAGWPAW